MTGAVRPPVSASGVVYTRATGPARTLVSGKDGVTLAVLTDGSRTARLTGPRRTFVDPTFTSASVTTDAWVRLLPRAWSRGDERERWFLPWLNDQLADTGPDVLGVAMQYVDGAPQLHDAKGIRYAGAAGYGPVSTSDVDGRAENSDFNDYLGIDWVFPDRGRVRPRVGRYGEIDCSGYIRLVYGYRLGYPLDGLNTRGKGLPRRAYALAAYGPGIEVVGESNGASHDLSRLQAGDVVFFDTDPTSADVIDHAGIYIGVDDAGHYRFISSRSRANGPTFGDVGGAAILDGGGFYAQSWRSARRF
jgi:NlpC/P60 family protein